MILLTISLVAGNLGTMNVLAAEDVAPAPGKAVQSVFDEAEEPDADTGMDVQEDPQVQDVVDSVDEPAEEVLSESVVAADDTTLPNGKMDEETALEEEPAEVSEEETELLGDGELELSGDVLASNLQDNKNYVLVNDATILLADGVEKRIGTITKSPADSDFTITIKKASEDDEGTGRLTIDRFYMKDVHNQVIVEGGIVESVNRSTVGVFKLNGGEVHSAGGIRAESSIEITDGFLDCITNDDTAGLYTEGDLRISGGTVKTVSGKSDAMIAYGDLSISGGTVFAYALAQGTSSDCYGIRAFHKNITITGDAIVLAKGAVCAMTSGNGNGWHITIGDTLGFVSPIGGKITRINQQEYTTDSARNKVPEVKIAPVGYTSGIETVYELDFGTIGVGYDQAACDAKEKTLTVTNKSSNTVNFDLPVSEKYDISAVGSYTDIDPNGSASFKIKPKVGSTAGNGNELITVSTNTGLSADVMLILKVGYFLSGDVAASTIGYKPGTTYTLTGDTKITLADSDTNVLVYSIDCKSYDLTIEGSNSGKISFRGQITMASTDAMLTLNGGNISASSISGSGSVTVNGGTLTCATCIQLQGDFYVTGGTVKITDGHQNGFAMTTNGDISISGGEVDINNTKSGTAIKAKGDISIENATVKAVTAGTYGIQSTDGSVSIGAGSNVHAKGSDEAIKVPGGSGKEVSVHSDLFFLTPKNGYVATTGDNKGHIVDADGNPVTLVKIVDEKPVVTIEASPTSLSFGRVPHGYKEAPAAQDVVVKNTGSESISLAMPSAVRYDITTTSDYTNIPAGGTVTFSVRPKTGLARGEGNETLVISTADNTQTIEVELELTVEYLLIGEMEAADLDTGGDYTIVGNTTLHIADGDNRQIYKIKYENQTDHYSLTITGEGSGKLSAAQGIDTRGDITITGGTVNANYEISTFGNISISGGTLLAQHLVANNHDFTVSGGTVDMTSNSGDLNSTIYADNVMVTGGALTVNASMPKPVIKAEEKVEITGGTTELTSDRNTLITAKNVTIGGDAILDAKTTASSDDIEAITSTGSILIEKTLNLVSPADGFVKSIGSKTHIVDVYGQKVKYVRFYPVVLAADPNPVNFGGGVKGYMPPEKTVTVTNTDEKTVNLNAITSSSYEIGDLSKTRLATGETATFTVKPKDALVQSVGTHRDTLKLTTDQEDIFVEIPVSYTVCDPGDKLWIADIDPQSYTGAAIMPVPVVWYQGKRLSAAEYSVKYSGNVNVSRNKAGEVLENGAKITVTGKDNFTGKAEKSFTILPQSLGEGTADAAEGITVGTVMVVKNSKATPVLAFGNYKLGTKDYTVADANKKYTENGVMTVEGKGNFSGSVQIPVTVVDSKTALKTMTVVADTKTQISYDPLKSDDQMQGLLAGLIKVYDSKDKKKEVLLDTTKYALSFPSDVKSAGTKTIQIIGIGEYSGSANVKLTVKPLAVKTATDGLIETNAVAIKTASATSPYSFDEAGVTIGDKLTVNYVKGDDTIPLVLDTDYTISYKDNKAVSTDTKKATYTINFIGNYKGTPVLKNAKATRTVPAVDDYSFSIGTFSIEHPPTGMTVAVKIPDVVYAKKADLYQSAPYVEINGVELAAKNYSVAFYRDAARNDVIDKNHKLEIPEGQKEATVYVKITGKGNYGGTLQTGKCKYKVLKTDAAVYDLSKAKVTLYQEGYVEGGKKNKKLTTVSYNGKERKINDPDVKGTVVVEYKTDGKNYSPLKEGEDYELVYVNNVNKGKATLIVQGTNSAHDGKTFVGNKKTSFTIGTKSVSDVITDVLAFLGLA